MHPCVYIKNRLPQRLSIKKTNLVIGLVALHHAPEVLEEVQAALRGAGGQVVQLRHALLDLEVGLAVKVGSFDAAGVRLCCIV
jgi:hypothetical protein